MARLIVTQGEDRTGAALRAMFVARKQVFIDLLTWDLPALAGRYEIDQFDDENARYLILHDSQGQHLGSTRLLPTDRPHILDTLLPQLCAGGPPRGAETMEITRFCLDRRLAAFERRIVRNQLVTVKSGCFAGSDARACPVLLQQIPALEAWIDDAARGPHRFAVLGDWNRRLGLSGDRVWTEIDDGDPANADLRLADDGTSPRCDPRYDSFIDHIVLDRRGGANLG